MTDKIKSCRFCGSPAVCGNDEGAWSPHDREGWYVMCLNEDCNYIYDGFRTRTEAIEHWNKEFQVKLEVVKDN